MKHCTKCTKENNLPICNSKIDRIVGKTGFLRPDTCSWHRDIPKVKKTSKRRTLTPLNAYDKKCEKIWKQIIKDKADWKCEYCGEGKHSGKQVHAHHIFSRANTNTRWDIDNGIALCPYHHTFNYRFSAHAAPAEFHEWLQEYKGKEFMVMLRAKKEQLQDRDMTYYIKTLKELEKLNENT